jgi:hypothetical protein
MSGRTTYVAQARTSSSGAAKSLSLMPKGLYVHLSSKATRSMNARYKYASKIKLNLETTLTKHPIFSLIRQTLYTLLHGGVSHHYL